MGIYKSKIKQNLVVLMEPFEDAHRIDIKAGNMILNRFCIDEDAAFELSGVNYLEKTSRDIEGGSIKFEVKRKEKGKEIILTILFYFEKLNFHEQLIILSKRTI